MESECTDFGIQQSAGVRRGLSLRTSMRRLDHYTIPKALKIWTRSTNESPWRPPYLHDYNDREDIGSKKFRSRVVLASIHSQVRPSLPLSSAVTFAPDVLACLT